MHYYQFNIADYRKDTGHLSTLEHGIYRQLLDWYYLDEKPIPLETQTVIRRLRLGSETDIEALQNILLEYFEKRETGYHQLKCDMVIREYHQKSAINKENGKLGGRPRKTKSVISAFDSLTESKPNQKATINHKPITNNYKPNNTEVQTPDGVSSQVWQDFIKSRKVKLTQTAIDGIQKEATKAGWLLEDALRECCARGWRGFKADWVLDKQGATSEPAWRTEQRNRTMQAVPNIAENKMQAVEFFEIEGKNVTTIELG